MTKRALLLVAVLLCLVGYLAWSHLTVGALPGPKVKQEPSWLFPHEPLPPRYPAPGPGQALVSAAGRWHRGFEVSYFTPCGSQAKYWLEAIPTSNFWERARPFRDSWFDGRPLFIHGTFYLSRRGNYGHLGQYERIVVFTAVDELRPERATDCEAVASD